jgi:hypothetical protein
MEYRLLIDFEVVEIIQRLPRRLRDDLLMHFQRIRDYPSRYVDYYEQDAIGRRVEISIYRRFAIHFWIDFADRHVKILALKPADT